MSHPDAGRGGAHTTARPCALAAWAFVLTVAAPCLAQGADDGGAGAQRAGSALANDPRQQVPITAYTYSAFGSSAGTMGATAFGATLTASGNLTALGGGLRVWGSPIDRFTIVLDGQRLPAGTSAPTAGALFRVAGSLDDGWALSALGRYKNDGFAHIEGEAEMGALLSYARGRLHGDANTLFGGDFDGQEMDAEGRARIGYDLTSFVRVGLDAQWRYRVAGLRTLPGGRKWDFVGGPQVLFGYRNFVVSVTAGPSTVDVVSGVGWSLLCMAGGMTL